MSLSPIDPSLKQLAEQIGEAMVEQLWARLRSGDLPLAPEYLSPKQVSQLTAVSVKTLEAMRGERRGPPYYKIGGRIRYKIEDMREWMERGGPVE